MDDGDGGSGSGRRTPASPPPEPARSITRRRRELRGATTFSTRSHDILFLTLISAENGSPSRPTRIASDELKKSPASLHKSRIFFARLRFSRRKRKKSLHKSSSFFARLRFSPRKRKRRYMKIKLNSSNGKCSRQRIARAPYLQEGFGDQRLGESVILSVIFCGELSVLTNLGYPWMSIGDFNAIAKKEDKSGGTDLGDNQYNLDFSQFISANQFHSIQSLSNCKSWCNNHYNPDSRIYEELDRALANEGPMEANIGAVHVNEPNHMEATTRAMYFNELDQEEVHIIEAVQDDYGGSGPLQEEALAEEGICQAEHVQPFSSRVSQWHKRFYSEEVLVCTKYQQ